MPKPTNPKSLELFDWEIELLQRGNLNFIRRPADMIEGKIERGDQIHLVYGQTITPPRVVEIRYEKMREMNSERAEQSAKEEGWLNHPKSYVNL